MKRALIVMLTLPLGFAFGDGTDGLLLTDFDSRELEWITVNDNVMGGRSEGDFRLEEGVLLFRGKTNTDGGGFSSIRSRPGDLGLEGRAAIRLRVRGDGRTYTFRLTTEDSRAAWWSEFATTKDEWVLVRLPFDSFVPRWRGRRLDLPPPDPADVVALGLMIYDGEDGPFRLEVDWIRADATFTLEDLKWERRPLVLFAPKEDDERLRRQLAAVGEAREGFEERDMALVVAAPGSGLSAVEREALRAKLEVEQEEFTLCLVGKDGTVKLRADEPVPMAKLFERIDRMPMRRAEREGDE